MTSATQMQPQKASELDNVMSVIYDEILRADKNNSELNAICNKLSQTNEVEPQPIPEYPKGAVGNLYRYADDLKRINSRTTSLINHLYGIIGS